MKLKKRKRIDVSMVNYNDKDNILEQNSFEIVLTLFRKKIDILNISTSDSNFSNIFQILSTNDLKKTLFR